MDLETPNNTKVGCDGRMGDWLVWFGRPIVRNVPGFTGFGPTRTKDARYTDSLSPKAAGHNKGEVDMQYAMIYAFVVVAFAPLIGIWRAHVWAKGNGMVLRSTATSGQNQTA